MIAKASARPAWATDPGPNPDGAALRPWKIQHALRVPYHFAIIYTTARASRLTNMPDRADGGLTARHIAAGDILLFEGACEPNDGDITMVEVAPKEWLARIYRRTPSGPEYHPDAPGFPILRGQYRTWGVLVGVVRDYAREDDDVAEDGKEATR